MGLNRSVMIEIGGKERELKFTIQAVEQLEAIIPEKNIYKVVANPPISVTNVCRCLYVGLRSTDKKVTMEKVHEWLREWLDNNDAEDMQNILGEALAKAGVFGKVKQIFGEGDDVPGTEGK